MKRFGQTVTVLAAAMICALTPLSAQDGSSSFFKFGVKGGINFTSLSHFELGYISESVNNYTGFNAGVAFSFDLPVQGMTIQPELNYVSKGAVYRGPAGSAGGGPEDIYLRTDYVELPVNLQVGLDLILLRPYIMVSPYIGYAVLKQPEAIEWSGINRFQYGIGIGGGVDFWRFQLQVKYNWNFGQFARNVPESLSEEDTGLQIKPTGPVRLGNYRGLEVNLVFFF